MNTLLAALAILGFVAALFWWSREGAAKAKLERRAAIDPILPLIDGAAFEENAADYPKVRGLYEGRPVLVAPHLDSIGVRKLPVLWLMVTFPGKYDIDGAGGGAIAVMMRPRNTEYWSPFEQLDVAVPTPPGFPEHANVRAQNEGSARAVNLLLPLAGLLAEPNTKEILLTSKAVRITMRAAEADRGNYLLMRGATFAGFKLDTATVEPVLQHAHSLVLAIEARAKLENSNA